MALMARSRRPAMTLHDELVAQRRDLDRLQHALTIQLQRTAELQADLDRFRAVILRVNHALPPHPNGRATPPPSDPRYAELLARFGGNAEPSSSRKSR
jgi:hypothetical protein